MSTPTPPPGYGAVPGGGTPPPPPGYVPAPGAAAPPPIPPGYVPAPPGYVPAPAAGGPTPPYGYYPPQQPAGPPPSGPPSGGGRVAPWMIIVAVAVILVAIGGVGLLIARSSSSVTGEVTTTTPSTGPISVDPLNTPAPSPSPLNPSPVSSGDPSPTPTETELVSPSETDVPSPEPTQTTGTGTEEVVELGDGLLVVVPPGWEVVDRAEGGVVLGTEGAVAAVQTATGFQSQTASEVSLAYAQQVLQGSLEKFKAGKPEPLDVDSPTVTSAAVLPYKGVLASQQGSQNVIGAVFVFIRQDGTALLVDETQLPDVDVSDGLAVILGSLLQTF